MKPAIAVVFSIALMSGALAAANGGTLRLANAIAGPYMVSVWTERDPRAGPVDLTIAVMQPQSREAVLDARVNVLAERTEGNGAPVKSAAVRGAGGNLLLYHAEPELPAAGRWRITVIVTGALGTGTTLFDLLLAPARPPIEMFIAVTVIAGLVGWMLWRARAARGHQSRSSSRSVNR